MENSDPPLAVNQLRTVQRRAKLNEVYFLDKPGPGGAHHLYGIAAVDPTDPMGVGSFFTTFEFQREVLGTDQR